METKKIWKMKRKLKKVPMKITISNKKIFTVQVTKKILNSKS